MKALIFSSILFFSLLFPTFTVNLRPLKGSSMQPTFYEGDVAIWTEADISQNLEGKIIFYRYNSTLDVCHRVIEDNGVTLIVRGDNNKANDPKVYTNQILGEVTAFLPAYLFKLYIISLILSYILFMTIAIKTAHNLFKTYKLCT